MEQKKLFVLKVVGKLLLTGVVAGFLRHFSFMARALSETEFEAFLPPKFAGAYTLPCSFVLRFSPTFF
uniref:Putative secreted protein n=1 Tax=Anopheles darlingi TaxID=43151 RepID=A0A2M4D015_ANODA